MSRKDCERYNECGPGGHIREGGIWKRCPCLENEVREKYLGVMYCKSPILKTNLRKKIQDNLVLEGSLSELRPHVSGAMLNLKDAKKSVVTIDAYRLIEIFLEKDEQYKNSQFALDADLLILMLGFGDPPNRYLPELLNQVLNRRNLLRLPTWIVMGVSLSSVPGKYNQALFNTLSEFEKVKTS